MGRSGKILLRVLAVALPAALGVASVLFSDTLRQPPAAAETKRPTTPVRVITMAPVDIIPRVSGYGTVAPAREWRAVARVAGEIIETADALAPGALVPAGTVLFRIDDSDLKLDLAEIDAQLASSRAQEDTVRASLALARSDLELARADLARQERLSEQGVTTQATLDTTRRQELAARSKVTDFENQLVLNAASREVLVAQRASLERSLGFVVIRAPYDLRISELSADQGQYVSAGQTLLSAEGVDAADIAAQFPIGRMGPLLRLAGDGMTVFDLQAEVRLPAPGHTAVWPARVARVGEAIDAPTQSAAVVVRVDDPQGQSVAGQRPPLRRNMLVEVVLSAPKATQLVAPAAALREGVALVVSGEGTLEKRKVETGFGIGEIAVVTAGLKPGDKLVVTDPTIAVPGMAVKPVEDEALKASIAAAALGQAAPAGSGGGAGAGKKKKNAETDQ